MNTETIRQTATVAAPIRKTDLVTKLRERAQKDKAFNAVCHIFAIRERTRQQITLPNLKHTMLKEGFSFSTTQYESILEFMASNGLGRLEKGPRGQVRALKDIKITLQSIGMAAIAKGDKLSTFKPSAKFQTLDAPAPAPAAKVVISQPEPLPKAVVDGFTVSLQVNIAGKVIDFVLPKSVSPQELSDIMTKFLSHATN